MGMSTTRYTLIWGFYTNSNMLVREDGFEGAAGRKAAMARVIELMSKRGTPYVGSAEIKLLAVLEVYAEAPDGKRTKSSFRPHVEGSRFIQWRDAHGQGWAVSSCELGETIG